MKNLIKKILKEEIDNRDHSMVYNELSDYLVPVKEFIYNKMKDCVLVPIKNKPGWTKYVDKNGKVLFTDNINTGNNYYFLYADQKKIWEKCEEMGCSLDDFKKICTDMLYEVHKRKVVTTINYDLRAFNKFK